MQLSDGVVASESSIADSKATMLTHEWYIHKPHPYLNSQEITYIFVITFGKANQIIQIELNHIQSTN